MKLAELTADSRNANKGTPRGRKMVADSLKRYGAGRSILVDREGNIIAGNKTAEGAKAVGLDDVIVVKTDGSKLVAVQRTALQQRTKESATPSRSSPSTWAVALERMSDMGLKPKLSDG